MRLRAILCIFGKIEKTFEAVETVAKHVHDTSSCLHILTRS